MRTPTSPRLQWRDVVTGRLGVVCCLVAPPRSRLLAATGPPEWVWVLHGRESSAREIEPVVAAIAAAVDDGSLPACTIVAPDAPWSQRMSWWADSAFTGVPGGPPAGAAVETGLLEEVLPLLEASTPEDPRHRRERVHRTVVGISMGGSAALRWLLRPDRLFDAALLLSPAAYRVVPPFDSSARTSGAFGVDRQVFDASRFAAVAGWEALLDSHRSLPHRERLRVVTLVGDDELAQDGPARYPADPVGCPADPGDPREGGVPYDLDLQAAQLHAALRRRPDIDASLRITGGGHDVELWRASVVAGLRLASAGTARSHPA